MLNQPDRAQETRVNVCHLMNMRSHVARLIAVPPSTGFVKVSKRFSMQKLLPDRGVRYMSDTWLLKLRLVGSKQRGPVTLVLAHSFDLLQ